MIKLRERREERKEERQISACLLIPSLRRMFHYAKGIMRGALGRISSSIIARNFLINSLAALSLS